ncbi:RNA polymerase sigma factor SigI [Virgibacillus siamensis]|uniref:RNA polymerase sigma factor SigI n=1 Tax=Virgibacillus siamensis TaxID=480071 RepID=UPI0009851CCC|nr:RNA polymerase sigma factor SigI [Virgibacillus siamensis]
MMKRSSKDKHLNELIAFAQQGDADIQNELLEKYQPFIAKCVSEVCKRYIDVKKDDEFSIGLAAFNEAILSYSPEKGSSFLSFSKLVVKRKVIDYIRYVQKTPVAASLDESYDEEQMENPTEIVAVKEIYQKEQESWYRREEIFDFQEKLRTFKLSMAELTEVSPKHRDARDSAILVAKILYKDPMLRQYVQQKKKLPIKDLEKKVDVSKKTLERNRKFILAIFIILSEDYLYLKEYLKGVG